MVSARIREAACHLLYAFLCALSATVFNAAAHEPSKGYLNLIAAGGQITGQLDIPLKDLKSVVLLDTDKDGFVTREELDAGYKSVQNYVTAHFKIISHGRTAMLRFTDTEPAEAEFADGSYLQIPFAIEGLGTPDALQVDYRMFFEVNSLHRGLLRLEFAGHTQTAVFTPETCLQQFELGKPNRLAQFVAFLKAGIDHIWTGYDHILFLVALLLPAVLRREGDAWRGVTQFRPALVSVIKIVTAFTIAHSITLSLATLHIVRLPSRLTESAIAASVILAATNNLVPMVRERGWIVAFAFGLIHGFGFANALSELGLTHGALLVTLVGFNLGVEIGQLCIVAVFFPAAYLARRSWWYQKPALGAGSALIILIAGTWLAERVCNVKVLPF